MGMYDSVKLKNIKCPNCEKNHTEWIGQTKDFHCSLDTFIFPCSFKPEDGTSWEKTSYHDEMNPAIKTGSGKFHFYGSCQYCDEYFDGTGYLKYFIFYKYIFENEKLGVFHKHQIPPSKELAEILGKNQELINDMRAYKEVLSGVLMALLNGDRIGKENVLQIIKRLVPKLGLLESPKTIYGRMFRVLKIIEGKDEDEPKDDDLFL